MAPAVKRSARVMVLWAGVPFSLFLGTLLNFQLLYHQSPTICVLVLFIILLGSISPMFSPIAFPCCWHGWIIKESMRGFSILLFLATLAGALIGIANYQHNIGPSLEFGDRQWYKQMDASRPAKSVADAIAFSFTKNTFVDGKRAAGYMSIENLSTAYCAAPIYNTKNQDSGITDYWAVGTNCCDAKGKFWCDDASHPLAYDGIVLLNQPYMFLSPRRAHREAFMNAINMIRSQYRLPKAENVFLLRWVNDAAAVRNLWAANGGRIFLIALAAAAILCISIGVAAMIMMPVEIKRPSAALSEWKEPQVIHAIRDGRS